MNKKKSITYQTVDRIAIRKFTLIPIFLLFRQDAANPPAPGTHPRLPSGAGSVRRGRRHRRPEGRQVQDLQVGDSGDFDYESNL